MTDIKDIPLTSLSPKQMEQALDSLQLTPPPGCKIEDCLKLAPVDAFERILGKTMALEKVVCST